MNARKHQIVQFCIVAMGLIAMVAASTWLVADLLRRNMTESELPLAGDSIDSEIHMDFIRPVDIAAQMANNTMLRDWLKSGERDPQQIARYLGAIVRRNDLQAAFLVSNATRKYYFPGGVLKAVSIEDPADRWFFRVLTLASEHEINIDTDSAAPEQLTMFVNYRILDDDGKFLAATGIGIPVSALTSAVNRYASVFQRRVMLVGPAGEIIAESNNVVRPPAQATAVRREVVEFLSTIDIAHRDRTHSVRYRSADGALTHVNVRYVPELSWFLLVERDEPSWAQVAWEFFIVGLVIAFSVLLANAVLLLVGFRSRSLYLNQKSLGLAAMSHDLKHLVGAIETLIMPEGSGCGSCQSRHALGLRALVSEIRMLGERFLAFYRLDMGVNRPQLRAACLIEMLNQLKEESEPLLAASGRGFELVVPEADCWVYTDKLLFKIILRNFIANAIKYASTGNLGLTVDLTEDRRRAKIRILDHGPGLGPALGERAFDLFSRGDSAPGRSGHGIGLFMVAYYARRLHCEVGLEEAYRDGACFWISIPRANQKQIQRELKQQAAASQLIQTLEAPLSGLRIAVIRLPGAADYLRKWGAEVHLLEAHASFGDQWPRFNAVLIGQPEHESPIAGLAEGAGSGAVPFLMAAIAGKDGLPDVFCPLAFHRWPISPPRFKAELLGIFRRARLAGD